MNAYHYVYILESIDDPSHRYVGLTDDLKQRLCKHNAGSCAHTSKYRPWRIRVAIAFTSREQASAFEKYLRTHSGRAFSVKHF